MKLISSLLVTLMAFPAMAQNTPCGQASASCQGAMKALTEGYETCRARVQNVNSLLKRCKDQLSEHKRLREMVDSLQGTCQELSTANTALHTKYETMLEMSRDIEGLLTENGRLARKSSDELNQALQELNVKYKDCYNDNMTPFYLRAEFWGGTAIGAVVGGLAAFLVASAN